MSDTCASCGQQGTMIDSSLTMKGDTVPDAYSGACGANWGVYVPRIAAECRTKKLTAAQLRQAKAFRWEAQR